MSGNESKAQIWVGRVLSALPALLLFFSGGMKLVGPPAVIEGFTQQGWPNARVPLGVVEILCTIIYLVPQTAVFGAILLTGYLGGAVATHVRNGDPAGNVMTPILAGVFVWLGLYLRDARLRALVPLKRPDAS